MNTSIAALRAHLDDCKHADRHALQLKLNRLKSDDAKGLEKLQGAVAASCEWVAKRRERIAAQTISYPDLPISNRRDEVAEAIAKHQVVVLAGETGSGKTTQLPKICLDLGLGSKGLIGHTQPRRLAARTVSSRIADELNTSLGDLVGYQVRFTDQTSDSSMVKVMTDGVLLAEIKRDKYLNRYDAIIIDEAHERSLNIDFLMGYLKQLLPKRPELKVIITSATIDVERFSKHFEQAPVIEVSGRTFPVEVEYWGAAPEDEFELSLPEQIEQVVLQLPEQEKQRGWGMGDVLVFLPGEREIREVSQHLRHADLRDTEVTPLYARLSNAEQQRIFQSHSGRRIVLSTNVAETSITVPGIRYVIDSGLVRMSRYSYRSKIQRLPIERISQASANQRAGRCGRVAEGICYRLYTEEDFLTRPEFTDPEILRTNLASVILKMKDSGLGEVQRFPFVDMPDKRLWNDGFKLLFELGAVNDKNNLTQLGRKLAYFPIDPRLAKVLIKARELGCYEQALVIVSALSIQDPRERPAERQQAADQAHAQYKDEDSDFVSYLNLWESYEAQRQELSNNQLKRYCQKRFLSPLRMREWRDLHRQLHLLGKDASKQTPANKTAQERTPPLALASTQAPQAADQPVSKNYDALHQALLSGFVGQIGRHDEKREYLACRNRRFQVFPGSALARKKAKWLVSAEIVETQQVYARTNAKIDVAWIEPLAAHLVKKSWSEPHWQKKRGQVVAFEKVTLYGLEIVAKRMVNFGAIDVATSREIFIRSALVDGEYSARAEQVRANQALLKQLEALEDRTRRRDIVLDEQSLFELYDQVIPAHIVSSASFEKWYKGLAKEQREALRFSRQQLSQGEADSFDPSQYPDTLENNGIRFPLSYNFDPSSEQDGVSISVPVGAARQVTAAALEKMVPGLLKEKCIQLVKNLPRTLRKNFVPVPDVVTSIFAKVEASELPLLEALSNELRYKTGVTVPMQAWNPELLDKHLRFNIKIVDHQGKTLEQGRDLIDLVQKVDHLVDQAPRAEQAKQDDTRYTDWDFGELEDYVEQRQAGILMKMFPALKDGGSYVEKTCFADAQSAQRSTRIAQARLYLLRLTTQVEQFKKVLPNYQKLALLYAPVGQAKQLYEDFALMCVIDHFDTANTCRNKAEFEARFEAKRGDFVDACRARAELVFQVLSQFHALNKALKGKVNLAMAVPMSDLQAQLEQLIGGHFLVTTEYARLESYPRYLEACRVRLDKMPREMGKERQYVPILKQWWQQYSERKAQFDAQGIWDEQLEHFRWLIEEQRVSWYAQQLKTPETVSEKRLNRFWQEIRRG